MRKQSKFNLVRREIISMGLAGLLAVSGSSTSCTPAFIPNSQRELVLKQVERKPYAALFEGLQPFSGYRMKEIAESLEKAGIPACATSGNEEAHMELIRKAYSNNQRISIAGFSMGENAARTLAEKCEREGIKVDTLILIDGTDLGDIPANVRKAVDIRGYSPEYLARRSGRYSEANLKNKNTVIKKYNIAGEHLEIPSNSKSIIIGEILGD